MATGLPSEALAAIAEGQAIVCTTRCYPCQFGQHERPKRWHTWADAEDIEHARKTGQPDPSKSRCGCPCADRLPEVQRPNGKPYRPRSLRVVGWDVTDVYPEVWQVAVLGTHDIDEARKLAPQGYHCPYLINPTLGWVRQGMRNGEPTWLHDEARGAACVIFDESDDPAEVAAALRDGGTE